MRPHGDNANVLIVDDEPQTIRLMLEILARKGIVARLAADREAALNALEGKGCDLAFLSTVIAGAADHVNGFKLLGEIRAAAPEMPVVMMAESIACSDAERRSVPCPYGHATNQAVRAIQAGCRDFLLKPLDGRAVDNLLESLLPNRRVATAASAREGDRRLYQIVGKSPKLVRTITLAERIAPTSVPVLISGESGTGKELIALLIHHKSRRSLGPFVQVNCAALSDSLLESELFGHEKGAFTGAYAQRKGRFEMAHGGTLLLDEITETPPPFQAKLLRIIEQQEFERVGGNENVKVNVRLLSTTNRDLLHEVQTGRFRQDLYYRLSAARIVLAPLRERRDDLPELVWHFVNLYAKEAQRRVDELDPTMMEIFANYDWPGNVRQLRNVVLTSLILGAGPALSLADVSWLFDELQPLPQQHTDCGPPTGGIVKTEGLGDGLAPRRWSHRQAALDDATHAPSCQDRPCHAEIRNPKSETGLGGIPLEDLERQAILETLRQTSGNQTKAAKVLGISDRTLREKMRRYRREECLATPNAIGRVWEPVRSVSPC
jgi:DNA-binding NtrC family response regulator